MLLQLEKASHLHTDREHAKARLRRGCEQATQCTGGRSELERSHLEQRLTLTWAQRISPCPKPASGLRNELGAGELLTFLIT